MSRRNALTIITAMAALLAAPALAQSQEADKTQGENEPVATTELDLPMDEKIKVKVDPFIPGSLVDRVTQPCSVIVDSANTSEVEIFVVPVDAPYGGKAIGKPHSVGKDAKAADGFKIMWVSKEQFPYVKLFAVVERKTGIQRRYRSHTLDFGMGGSRLEPQTEKH